MAITTLDGLIAAIKQDLPMAKTASNTVIAGQAFSLLNTAGYPAAKGDLNPGNVVAGAIPVSGNAGFPLLNSFGANKGYVSRGEVVAPVSMSIALYDVLFWAGATTIPTSGTTTIALAGMPDWSGRLPFKSDGVTIDYSGVELWVLASTTTSNHAHTFQIDYTDQGNAAGTTGALSTTNLAAGNMRRLALAAGDDYVKTVTGYKVNGIASSTGTVAALAMRRVGMFRTNGLSAIYGPDLIGMPEIKDTAALMMVCFADSTASSTPSLNLDIAQG
jgi:microcystin-dependent protein